MFCPTVDEKPRRDDCSTEPDVAKLLITEIFNERGCTGLTTDERRWFKVNADENGRPSTPSGKR